MNKHMQVSTASVPQTSHSVISRTRFIGYVTIEPSKVHIINIDIVQWPNPHHMCSAASGTADVEEILSVKSPQHNPLATSSAYVLEQASSQNKCLLYQESDSGERRQREGRPTNGIHVDQIAYRTTKGRTRTFVCFLVLPLIALFAWPTKNKGWKDRPNSSV